MTTYLGKSCSFCLPRVPFVNCRQFMYLVISLLVLRAGYGIWLYQFLIIAYLFTFISDFIFDFTAAGFVPCGGRKTSPRTSTIVQFIFYFGPLRSAIIFWEIRNKWLVKTHIIDRYLFIWTPFWFISVFESTAYLKFAKLQYVSSGFRCRVITGSLMRLY